MPSAIPAECVHKWFLPITEDSVNDFKHSGGFAWMLRKGIPFCRICKRRPSNRATQGTRAALYLRVSTAEQKPDLQYDGLRAYAARAGLDVVQDYCDVGVSGRREGRPQLNALMAAARNREIDCVLVWKFDRFARSTRHSAGGAGRIQPSRCALCQRPGSGGYRQPDGRAMFTIIGAMAELELSLISERVTAGMRAAETRGKHWAVRHPQRVIREIETLATSTDLGIRQIQSKITGRASRGTGRRDHQARPRHERRHPCDNLLHVSSGYPCNSSRKASPRVSG